MSRSNHSSRTIRGRLGAGTAVLTFALAASRACPSPSPAPGQAAPWIAPDAEIARVNPVAVTGESLKRGGEIYQMQCAACHGVGGRGDGPTRNFVPMNPPDLSDAEFAAGRTDGEWFWKISTGRPPMMPFEGHIRTEDMWHVVNFTRSLSAPDGMAEMPSGANEGFAAADPERESASTTAPKKKKRGLRRAIGVTEVLVAGLLLSWIYMFKRRRKLARGR